MKSYARHMWMHLFILLLSVSVALFQLNPASAQSSRVFLQEELDQMLAPIALYPDALLSQILMASTYPLEVGEAARWSRANPGLKGDQAVAAVETKNWDPSVKSLVAFPQILTMMDERLDWTERLGDAFLSQQAQVMDTVQYLRQRAQAAGSLNSTDQIRVVPQGEVIVIERANPNIFYVPYYDPLVVYGPWWWPAYPPVYWAPWPGYYFNNWFAWDAGILIGAGFFFGAIDWPHRHVNVVNIHRRPFPRPGPPFAHNPPSVWQHNREHRLGVPYRETILRQKPAPGIVVPETRREFRGHDRLHDVPQMKDKGAEVRLQPGGAQVQPPAPAISRAPAGQPHVFEGVGQGSEVRDFSRRGHASSQTMQMGTARPPESRPAAGMTAPHLSTHTGPQPSGQKRGHGRNRGGDR